jgi:hypothetical protein
VKRESVKPTLHPEPKTASLIEHHDRHVTKRAHFIGNTSITPMSQQFYPGRLSQGADPLLGPRFVDQQHKEIENEDRGPGPPRDREIDISKPRDRDIRPWDIPPHMDPPQGSQTEARDQGTERGPSDRGSERDDQPSLNTNRFGRNDQ